MHREYLRGHKPIQYNCLLLSGELWTYLADLNQQAQDRLEQMIHQMKMAEGVTEELHATMTDAQKELFSRYADSVREFQDMAECLLFQNSFR